VCVTGRDGVSGSVAGIVAPAELALAFGVTRPFRRFMFPLEALTAVALARSYPVLTRFNISSLALVLKKVMPSTADELAKEPNMNLVADFANRYGVAYVIAARLVGVGSVFATYEAIRFGVDVSSWLEYFDIADAGECSAGRSSRAWHRKHHTLPTDFTRCTVCALVCMLSYAVVPCRVCVGVAPVTRVLHPLRSQLKWRATGLSRCCCQRCCTQSPSCASPSWPAP
jgi:hypothetical protein